MTSNTTLDFGYGSVGQALTSNGPGVAPTFQDQSGSLSLGYESGYYYQINWGGTVSTNPFQIPNAMNVTPFYVSHPTTFDSLTFQVTSPQNQNIRVGIYNMDGFATTLFKDLGDVFTSPTGVITASINLALNSGWYGLALQGGASAARINGTANGIAFQPWLPVGTAHGTTTPGSLQYAVPYSSGLVDLTALTPTLVTTAQPIISLRVA